MAIGSADWGPHGWKFIHYITLGYPKLPSKEDKKNFKLFFELIKDIVPCSICQYNYENHLKIYPLTDNILSNRFKMMKWGIDMHNAIEMVLKTIRVQ